MSEGKQLDTDFELLVAIAATLKADYIREGAIDPWATSPFHWVKLLSSRQIGKVGEQLIAGWCAAKGLNVTRSGDSEADRVIEGRRVEIKFSTLWQSGIYKFQQLRDQNYDYAICLGLSPFEARCWVISKELLTEHIIGHTGQHRGKSAADTFWLSFPANNPPAWLNQCGGSLFDAFQVIKTFR
jgi:hypothetical protein